MNAFKPGSNLFEDEFDIKTKLETLVRPLPGELSSMFVQVFRRNDIDRYTDFQTNIEEAIESDTDNIQKRINHFLQGKISKEIEDLKELKFIMNAGLPRDIAKDIDAPMRKKLETLFPILSKYQGLCFKQRPTTMRRMLIFPSKSNYKKYMEDMKNLLDQINMKFNKDLDSRVMLRFRGKYIVKIDMKIYNIFKEAIDRLVMINNITKNVKYQINRVDLVLFSTDDEIKKLQSCVNEIMDILATDDFTLPPKLQEFDLYPITSTICQKFIDQEINKYYRGQVYLRFEEKTQRLLINGVADKKKEAISYINNW
jgi:hypothetical protein